MREPTMRSLATVLLLLAVSAPARGQSAAVAAPKETGVIAGHVSGSDGLMTGVIVILSGGTPSIRRTATTDEQGAYAFPGLSEGRYMLHFDRPGFVGPSNPGAVSLFAGVPPGVPIVLAAGESRRDVNTTLVPWGVIVVRVSDDLGSPAAGVLVSVLALKGIGTARTTQPAQSAASNPRFWEQREFVTNDHGEVRLYGMAPGEYIVIVVPSRWATLPDPNRADHGLVYPRIYYPGTMSLADAGSVRLGAGEEISVNVSLVVVAAANVSGRVVRPDGQPGRAMVYMEGPDFSHPSELEGGRFTFWNVPPGNYTISSTYDPRGTERDGNGSVELTVGADDVTDVVLTGVAGNEDLPLDLVPREGHAHPQESEP